MRVRINKYLADHGIASRRAIDMLIAQKNISVNGIILDKPGMKVGEDDVIEVGGKRIGSSAKKHLYILLNKPAECITTSNDPQGRKTVLDYVRCGTRVYPIGRLDKDTTGALLLTNDGELANRLMHPKYSVEKIYQALLDKSFAVKDKKIFESGVMLDGKKTASCSVQYIQNNKKNVLVILHEGMNRQIHRMFKSLGYRVIQLDRIQYAGLTTKGLARGEWRYLTYKEIEKLKNITL